MFPLHVRLLFKFLSSGNPLNKLTEHYRPSFQKEMRSPQVKCIMFTAWEQTRHLILHLNICVPPIVLRQKNGMHACMRYVL